MPTDQSWLSVVMPVLNGAETLDASLASLVGQGREIEVVLVDQGSSDNSLGLARRYEDCLNLRIFEKPEHTNWIQNTNFGFSVARAPRVTMLHQDDVWMPGRVKLLHHLVDMAPDAALWLHRADYIDAQGRRIAAIGPPFGRRERVLLPERALPQLLVQNTIALPAAMFRTRDVQGAGGLDEALWYTADWELWLRLATAGAIAWSPISAVGFRLHAHSQTMTGSRDLEDFAQQLSVPVKRHASGMPPLALRKAIASNALNVWLAARYHGLNAESGPLIRTLLALGPLGLVGMIRDSRINARVLARLRMRF